MANHNKNYVCEECNFVFQIYAISKRGRKKYFCPSCGEKTHVTEYKAARNISGKRQKILYSPEEIELIHKCIKGELKTFQVALMIGRPVNAVCKRIARERMILEQAKKSNLER
jgi:ribosomal protein S27AE